MNVLNKLKRGLAALLSLSVALSAVFVFHFPMMKAYADNAHSHTKSQGGADGNGKWQPWPPQSVETEEGEEDEDAVEYPALPDKSGYFYLTADVEIDETWEPKDDTYLCLNGHSITMTANEAVIKVLFYRSFTLCDCAGGGQITHSEGCNDGLGVEVRGDCTFNMYSGAISGNTVDGSGAGVNNSGTFNMYGGEISKNEASWNGGGVFNTGTFKMYDGEISKNETQDDGGGVYISMGSFEMYGGKITGNTCGRDGDGVHISSSANMTVGGTPNITGNMGSNVNLNGKVITISDKKPLWGEDTEIGITANPDSKIAQSTDGKNYRLFFIPDDAAYGEHTNYSAEDGIIRFTFEEPDDTIVAPVKPSDPKPNVGNDDDDEGDEGNESGGETDPDNPDNPGGDKEHSHDGWEALDEDNPQTDSGNYFLEDDAVLTGTWEPADGTVLCLNGYSITGAIANVTLRNCETTGTANVTVGEDKTITVGGKLNADITLSAGALINVDGALEDGASITVATAVEPTADNPVAVTGENVEDYSGFFHSDNENYEFKTVDGKVVLTVKEQETPVDPTEHNPHDGDEDWKPFLDEEGNLPTEEGHYYLTNGVTIPDDWAPAAGTYICLNGQNISGTIGNSNVTLCNCKSTGTATVTVSENNTITVGGKLIADILLADGAKIDVDGDYPLTSVARITVALETALDEDASAAITTANAGDYSGYFHSKNTKYTKSVDKDGVITLTNPKVVVDPTKHTHPICGDYDCKDHHVDITWREWNSSNSLPTEAGSYYLTKSVTLGSRWNAASDINLCLNGYTITMNANDTAVYITRNLSLCDCGYRASAGTITHAGSKSGRGVYIASGGALTMYGGRISGNSSTYGGGVYNDGTFNMLGGYVTGNSASSSGGGLYNNGIALIEGDISSNSASKSGGGVYQDGKLTVDNDAYIMKNTVGSSKNNVYITDGGRIIIGSSYYGEAGISLETKPSSSNNVTFAKGSVSSTTATKLKSDSSSYAIKKSGDTLALYKKTSSVVDDDDDDDWELDIESKTSSQIPQKDRTAIIEMLKTMPDWVIGAYYDVTLYENGDEVDESTRLLEVEMTIPSSIRASNRAYKVIRVHNGKATLLDDIDSDPNTVTVRSRYFSTYAIIYSVSKSGAANGSSNGSSSNGGYGNPSMGVQNDIPIAGLACGFTVLALAAPGKKLENV